jgi:exopolysaccharide production protein ExoQ
MSDAASTALPYAAPRRPARAHGHRGSIVLSKENLIGAACFIFLVWASTGLRAVLPAFFAGERYLWLLADLVVVGWFLLFPGQVLAYARRNKILICWGLLACLSMIWSLKSALSLYYGLQLCFTILMGFLLCKLETRTRLIQILFLALLPTQLLSFYIELVAPHMAPGFPGGGAFTHKNVLGSFMLLQIINCLCLLAQGWRPLLTGFGFLTAAVLLVMSGSASSLLIAVFITGGLLPMALLYRANVNFARACVGIAGVIGVVAAMLILVSGYDPVKAVLGSVGRDATLTGRTVLWDFGWEAFLDRPWLGHGFRAYWESEKTTVMLLRYVIQQDLNIFHNNFVEVAVAFGVWGPALLVMGIAAAFHGSVMAFLTTRSLSALWSALFVIFVVSLSFAENPLFNNHGFLQALFVVAAAARDPARPAAARQRNRADGAVFLNSTIRN